MAKASAVGISLGTSNSCVGVLQNGKIVIIPNDKGSLKTPCFVAFTDTGKLIGDAARNQVTDNPANTIFDFKRFIGRKFDDPVVQNDMQHWPFIVGCLDSKPQIEVKYKGNSKKFFPEEISSIVLTKMKETAEAFLNHTVTDAVISVPANFNNSQRQATKDAAMISGLNVLQIINEPTAAAMAYAYHLEKKVDILNVLIFDFGGGKIDVSIVEIDLEERCVCVKFTTGITNLGGKDIDDCLIKHCMEKFKVNFNQDKSAMCRLRKVCEKGKENLSTKSNFCAISFEFNDTPINLKITRTDFEQINKDLFLKLAKLVEEAELHAKTENINIDDIVMLGGSSKLPMFEEIVQNKFLNKNIRKLTDELVCKGASLQAAFLQGETTFPEYFHLEDIIPLPLIVMMGKYTFEIPIQEIPLRRIKNFFPKDTSNKLIRVFEGKEPTAEHLLGEFELSDISRKEIEVSFDIDENGILNIIAMSKLLKKYQVINVTQKGRLSIEHIQRKKDIKAAEQHLKKLKSHCSLLMKNANAIVTECTKIEKLLELSTEESVKKEKYEVYRTTLDSNCKPFITKLCDAASVHTGDSSRSSSVMSTGRAPNVSLDQSLLKKTLIKNTLERQKYSSRYACSDLDKIYLHLQLTNLEYIGQKNHRNKIHRKK